MKILVRRTLALGDVVLTTPIVRRLRRENPDADITVQTLYPDVYRGNPHAVATNTNVDGTQFDRFVNLDLAYEARPGMHIVEAYMTEAFGDVGDPEDCQQELFYNDRPLFPRESDRKMIAVHAGRAGWANRTLPSSTWVEVCRLLREEGLWPILVGTDRDALPGAKATAFLSTDVLAQARLIASCHCFVGSDTGLLHVAGATGVPIVGVFTCARPALRAPWRNGAVGGGCYSVAPKLGCIYCLERQPAPATTETCERGDIACVRMVEPDEIVRAVMIQIEKADR